jgi:hypothetical protein
MQIETTSTAAETVADPVSHISISGVHGRDELDERLANAPEFREAGNPMKPLLIGVAMGAVLGAALALLARRR